MVLGALFRLAGMGAVGASSMHHRICLKRRPWILFSTMSPPCCFLDGFDAHSAQTCLRDVGMVQNHVYADEHWPGARFLAANLCKTSIRCLSRRWRCILVVAYLL